jgi:hypothetical protein
MTFATELKDGYDWSYRSFYSWTNICKASWQHDKLKHAVNISLCRRLEKI